MVWVASEKVTVERGVVAIADDLASVNVVAAEFQILLNVGVDGLDDEGIEHVSTDDPGNEKDSESEIAELLVAEVSEEFGSLV